jgi:hypothetical protein
MIDEYVLIIYALVFLINMNTSSLDYYISPQIYADDCPVLSYEYFS